jgi:hypothetical protein
MSGIYSAEILNKKAVEIEANRIQRVIGGKVKRSADGTTLDLRRKGAELNHPWKLSPQWRNVPDTQTSAWFARVTPGLVNGFDVVNQQRESIVLGNPIKLGVWVTGSPPKALEAKAEGRYVKRAEVILQTPRITASQQINQGLFENGGTLEITTVFDSSVFANSPRYQLVVRTEFSQQPEPDDLDFYEGIAAEPGYDVKHMATVWAISPDLTSEEVDETWKLYPQYHVFWNLNHASLAETGNNIEPLKVSFDTALAGGIGNFTVRQFLQSDLNEAEQVRAYLNRTKSKGEFWTV